MLCSLFLATVIYFLAPAILLSFLSIEFVGAIKNMLPDGYGALGLVFVLFLSWLLALMVFWTYIYKLIFQELSFRSEKYTIISLACFGPIIAIPILILASYN